MHHRTQASAKRVSSAITFSTSHTPAMSAMAMASAARRLAVRSSFIAWASLPAWAAAWANSTAAVHHGLGPGGKTTPQCATLVLRHPPQKGTVAKHRVQQRLFAGKALLGQPGFHARRAFRIKGFWRRVKFRHAASLACASELQRWFYSAALFMGVPGAARIAALGKRSTAFRPVGILSSSISSAL